MTPSSFRRPLGTLSVALGLAFAVAGVGQADDPGVEATLERSTQATPDDMLANTPGWVAEIQTLVKGLVRLDESSRRGLAEEGLPCVTTNLSAVKALLDVSEAAQVAMQQAIDKGDVERAAFEYRKIAIALKKSRELFSASEQCALGEGVQPGKTRRELSGQPQVSVNDTKAVPGDIVEFGFDPPDASPF